MTDTQFIELEKYQAQHCTSACGNDYDCPHEAEFLEANNIEE